jgi:hypothetical protein
MKPQTVPQGTRFRPRERALYGLIAEFAGPDELLLAARCAREAGFRRLQAYTPFPVEGLAEALGLRRDSIAAFTLIGGAIGGITGFVMQYYANVVDYPLDIGGRPFSSWPAFIPVTFELTILFGALTAFTCLLVMNRLPMPYHPVSNVPRFARASTDGFFLCIRADDQRFDLPDTRAWLERLLPRGIFEVEP